MEARFNAHPRRNSRMTNPSSESDVLLIKGDEDHGHGRLQDQDTADAVNARSAMGTSQGVSQNCLMVVCALKTSQLPSLRLQQLATDAYTVHLIIEQATAYLVDIDRAWADVARADAARNCFMVGVVKAFKTLQLITANALEKRRLMAKSITCLRNRTLGAAVNIWRYEYEQAFELSNLQLRARFCWTYRTLAESFRTWKDTTVDVRAACNRKAWSLHHWVYRQLSIAFDAWRQCLAKAQKGDLELRICTEDGIRFPITISTFDIDHCDNSLRYKSPFPLFELPVAATGACESIRDASIQLRLLSQVELSLSCTCANSNLSTSGYKRQFYAAGVEIKWDTHTRGYTGGLCGSVSTRWA